MDEGIKSAEGHATSRQDEPSVMLDQEGVGKESTLRLRRSRRATKDNISKKIDKITKCMSQLLSVEETSAKGLQFSKTAGSAHHSWTVFWRMGTREEYPRID